MARDYVRKSPYKTQRKKKDSHFGLWLFTIIIFISFTLGLVYLGKNRQQEQQHQSKSLILSKQVTAEVSHDAASVKKEIAVMENHKPRLQFDFDTPKKVENKTVSSTSTSVSTPKVTSSKTPAPTIITTSPAAKTIVAKAEKYVLYIAKVKDYGAVDRLKAQLALLGFEAKVVPVKENNVYFYKISVGPYEKKIALEKQQLLKQNKFSIVMKKVAGN